MTVFLRGIITPDYLPLVRDFFVAGRFAFSGVTRCELANEDLHVQGIRVIPRRL